MGKTNSRGEEERGNLGNRVNRERKRKRKAKESRWKNERNTL